MWGYEALAGAVRGGRGSSSLVHGLHGACSLKGKKKREVEKTGRDG